MCIRDSSEAVRRHARSYQQRQYPSGTQISEPATVHRKVVANHLPDYRHSATGTRPAAHSAAGLAVPRTTAPVQRVPCAGAQELPQLQLRVLPLSAEAGLYSLLHVLPAHQVQAQARRTRHDVARHGGFHRLAGYSTAVRGAVRCTPSTTCAFARALSASMRLASSGCD